MSEEKSRTIRLYGKLGNKFGRVHNFVCDSTAGAIRAMCAMLPGFERELIASREKGISYACFLDKRNISVDMLHAPAGSAVIRIAPIVTGAGGKNSGWVQAIIGVVLIVAAFYTGGASLSASGLAFSGLAGQMAFGLGVALALSGVTQLMMPMDTKLATKKDPDNGQSYHLNGPVNLTAQGNPVPLLYGELFIGSSTISASIYSEDEIGLPTLDEYYPPDIGPITQ